MVMVPVGTAQVGSTFANVGAAGAAITKNVTVLIAGTHPAGASVVKVSKTEPLGMLGV